MDKILTYSEFIKEDYRDVGYGSNSSGFNDNPTQLANGSTNTIIDVIGHPTGDKKVLGTEEIKNIQSDYFTGIKKKKEKRKRIDKWRFKISKNLSDSDKKSEKPLMKK